jgi:hypothetical protein
MVVNKILLTAARPSLSPSLLHEVYAITCKTTIAAVKICDRQLYLQGKLTALDLSCVEESTSAFESIFHIEEGGPRHTGPVDTFIRPERTAVSPIIAICACTDFLLLAQRDVSMSTTIHRLTFPELDPSSTFTVAHTIQELWLNYDASLLASVDTQVLRRPPYPSGLYCCAP